MHGLEITAHLQATCKHDHGRVPICHLKHELADLKHNVAAGAKNLNVRS